MNPAGVRPPEMIHFEPASFKDPAGRVFYHGESVCRTLSSQAADDFQAARDAGLIRELIDAKLLIDTEIVRATHLGLLPSECGELVLTQPRVPLVTYSYEWSFEMLRDAALVTLQILDRALAAGFILKDANSFNILFEGTVPKLVDAPSIERHVEGTLWTGYGQFCRSFLFPLLLAAYRHIDIQAILRGTLGEIPVLQAARMMRPRDRLRSGVLKDVFLQARLDRTFARTGSNVKSATSEHLYPKASIVANVRRLRAVIEGLRAPSGATEWSKYEAAHSYSSEDQVGKQTFVTRVLDNRRFSRVVDLGCNIGQYSHLALSSGASVIALDSDSEAIDLLYRRMAGASGLSPLVASLVNPSPAMGWELWERRSLLDRIRCDGFLALALIHHLRISGGVPLDAIVSQLLALAPEGIIEWVAKEDAMVRAMLSLRRDVYADYTWEQFESTVNRSATIVAVHSTHSGHRRLCHVRARPTGADSQLAS